MSFTAPLNGLCKIFDMTRQAFYKRRQEQIKHLLQEELIIQWVLAKRRDLPKLGGKKLYHLLKPDLRSLQKPVGRDRFFEILRNNNLLIKRKRRHARTTNSKHRFRKYKNLIKDLTVDSVNQIWISDITYLRTNHGFAYLSLVTDLFSRKIVGYDLSRSLAADGSIRALKMALAQTKNTKGIIHHSDRGVQYCSNDYVNLLTAHEMEISMTEENHIAENATAERVNGILKQEFDLSQTFPSFARAHLAMASAIRRYNQIRPHNSLKLRTPDEVYYAA